MNQEMIQFIISLLVVVGIVVITFIYQYKKSKKKPPANTKKPHDADIPDRFL